MSFFFMFFKEAIIPASLLYLSVSIKREFKNARQLQIESFAQEKKINIYESLVKEIIKTKKAISLSGMTFSGVISVIVDYVESYNQVDKDRNFSFITQLWEKMETFHKELNDSVEDLINIFRSYSMALHTNFTTAQQIEEKLSKIRALYIKNFPNALALKCAVEVKMYSPVWIKDIRYLFNEVAPEYKVLSKELTELVNSFGDEAQAALLGPLFKMLPSLQKESFFSYYITKSFGVLGNFLRPYLRREHHT